MMQGSLAKETQANICYFKSLKVEWFPNLKDKISKIGTKTVLPP